MTGYGKSRLETNEFNLSIEVKSINSKTLDLTLRAPKLFSEKELEIKNATTSILQRGKVSIYIDFQRNSAIESGVTIHKELFKQYYNELKKLAKEVKTDKKDLFRIALQLPNVLIHPEQSLLNDDSWKEIMACLQNALKACDQFRKEEGKNLLVDIIHQIESIHTSIHDIEKKDPARIDHLKTKLKAQLAEIATPSGLDSNRFEQEMIYYMEKLDINEEKVRLQSHLSFFLQTINNEETPGKKLGFIAQEIGREINTIGSKANDASIQHEVVKMKEELEKIKEQLNNIL